MTAYPKRLIEVDLPIRQISAHARREKSIRHGHISTLHIWWARRPLAACRAVLCAALWPDPESLTEWANRGDEVPAGNTIVRPKRFLDTARACMTVWATDHAGKASAESYPNLIAVQKKPGTLDDAVRLRRALLDFIADFANWDNSTDADYLATARALTQAAHEALGGEPGTRPLVVDPFAGGGSIPLEALRIGADAFAADLNPVAILQDHVLLQVPIDDTLISDFEKISREASDIVSQKWSRHFPSGRNNRTAFTYFWSRTIVCEGPDCGLEIPLLRGTRLSNRRGNQIHLFREHDGSLITEPSPFRHRGVRPVIKIDQASGHAEHPTCRNGSATCPRCGYTTKQSRVADQAKQKGFGHRLIALGIFENNEKTYRVPTIDEERIHMWQPSSAISFLSENLNVSINPDRPSPAARGMSGVTRYGYSRFLDLFSARQIAVISDIIDQSSDLIAAYPVPEREELRLLLSIAVDRLASFMNTFCRWAPKGEHPVPPFGKNGFPMVWDYAETNPFAEASGSWNGSIDWVVRVLRHIVDSKLIKGTVEQADARIQLLANDMANAFATDPPYYDSYPYADLSDFFYPFLRRMMLFEGSMFQSAFTSPLTPKNQEIVLQPSRIVESVRKDQVFYQESMTQSLKVGRIETRPDGIGIIIFANKATEAWEVFLRSVCNAGWIVTSSWPVQTERESRTIDQARLQSSIHLVCRPREDPSGDLVNDAVGDWRDVLEELPQRIRAWLPRLREEGIVGADAIFACLGPALEIFSRYARVEKASGEQVSLREYLEQVWAAVAREALSMIFAGAETTGLEADARLTAMWLWTLNTAANGAEAGDADEEETGDEEAAKPAKLSGFVLEYDAARKIAQGLGAHLDKLPSVVEVKGDKARLLPVAERARALFGKEAGETAARRPPKAKPKQMSLFAALGEVEEATTPGVATAFRLGETALDRLHQAMLLFAAGRGEALKRFLVEEGVGRDQRLWRLAQSLSALYPSHTEEKRWVDGVLARKKGLGL